MISRKLSSHLLILLLITFFYSCRSSKPTQEKVAERISIDNTKVSPEIRKIITEVEGKEVDHELAKELGLTTKESRYYVNGIAKMTKGSSAEDFSSLGLLISTQAGNIWTVSIPVEKLREFVANEKLLYLENKKTHLKME